MITKPKKAKADAAARARGSDGKFESATNDENQDDPQYGVLPSSINVVSRSCPSMSAFLLQDPAWPLDCASGHGWLWRAELCV